MKKNSGFDIVKLLVVLVILAILAALFVSQFEEDVKKAEERAVEQTRIEMNVDTVVIMDDPNYDGTKVYCVNDNDWGYKSVQFVDYGPTPDLIPDQIVVSKTARVIMDPDAFKPGQWFPVADAEILYLEDGPWLARFTDEVIPAHNKEKEEQRRRNKK